MMKFYYWFFLEGISGREKIVKKFRGDWIEYISNEVILILVKKVK